MLYACIRSLSAASEISEDKHFIGDFLPPAELAKFIEKTKVVQGICSEPGSGIWYPMEYAICLFVILYASIRQYWSQLTDSNIKYKILHNVGWSEGEELGSKEDGIKALINMWDN